MFNGFRFTVKNHEFSVVSVFCWVFCQKFFRQVEVKIRCFHFLNYGLKIKSENPMIFGLQIYGFEKAKSSD